LRILERAARFKLAVMPVALKVWYLTLTHMPSLATRRWIVR